jgi:hypothetical protein
MKAHKIIIAPASIMSAPAFAQWLGYDTGHPARARR